MKKLILFALIFAAPCMANVTVLSVQMCFHLNLWAIDATVPTEIPNFSATSFCIAPSSSMERITRTSSSFKIACPFREPRGGTRRSGYSLAPFLSPFAARPFLAISAELSAGVPKNKCLGFTHNFVSHLWRTQSLLGIEP
jgi:hypothetical protein